MLKIMMIMIMMMTMVKHEEQCHPACLIFVNMIIIYMDHYHMDNDVENYDENDRDDDDG